MQDAAQAKNSDEEHCRFAIGAQAASLPQTIASGEDYV